jgi:DNA-binding transcriptional LysR family regulator
VRVVLKVVELSSFAAGARSLKMTPASVTHIVAKLEEDLGQQLLVRTTRQVSLTSTGAMIAARFGPLVEDFDRVIEDVSRAVRPMPSGCRSTHRFRWGSGSCKPSSIGFAAPIHTPCWR